MGKVKLLFPHLSAHKEEINMKSSTKKALTIACSSILLALNTGCATSLTQDNYSRADTRVIQEVDYGSIIHVRAVIIDGNNTGQVATTGSMAGSLGGFQIGSGNAAIFSSLSGSLIGSVTGEMFEEHVSRKKGVELVVQLSNGRTIAIVQEGNATQFPVGQKVRVMSIGQNARVVRDDSIQ
ncbi:MAG: hypothetical protein ACRCV6_01545 [Formosimonas sp.]